MSQMHRKAQLWVTSFRLSFPTHTLKLPLKLQKKIQYSYRNVPETMTNRQQRRRHVIHGSLCVKPSCKKPRRAETIHLSIERISFFKIAHCSLIHKITFT